LLELFGVDLTKLYNSKFLFLIRRNFFSILPNYKWYSDVSEFKLNGQKTYLSTIINGCTQEIISYTISYSPNLRQTMTNIRVNLAKASGTI